MLRLEFSFPDNFADLLDTRLHQLRRERISKSAFLTVAVLKALDVDAELWPRGHHAPKDNGGGPVPSRRPPRPDRDPNPDDDGDDEDQEQDEVEPAMPDLKAIPPSEGAPPNLARPGVCSRCHASVTKAYPHDDKLFCGSCLDVIFWASP